MDPALTALLDAPTLRRLARAESFRRGRSYFNDGAVESLTEDVGSINAKVIGTKPYRAKLWVDGNALGYSCSCPVGDDGDFCKHLVAVGLSALAGRLKPMKVERKPQLTMKDLKAYLEGEEKVSLVKMLMERAEWDDALRDQLLLKVARSRRSGGPDVAALKEAVDAAVYPDDYVSWKEAADYSNGVEEAVKAIEGVLKDGHVVETIELAEHALRAVEEAMNSVDDSDGYMGGLLERIQELHHAACRKAKPEPVALARKLFAWEMETGFDVFYLAVATYSDVLGKKGLAEYRKLAEVEWEKLPALRPNARSDRDEHPNRFRLTSIMEKLAELSGDLDARVAVMSKDLAHAHDFLQVAEVYRNAKRYDEALDWAERGLTAFPERTDGRLREFLATEYHRRKYHEEAMELMWKEFTESPVLENYKKLKSHAEKTDDWSKWRERALAYLRDEYGKKRAHATAPRWGRSLDQSTLVEIFMWEQRVDEAWVEAQKGGCSDSLWMALAEKREKDHPGDAVAIYKAQVERTLEHPNNNAYAEAVRLLRRTREIMVKMENEEKFGGYLASVRVAHKQKRNLMRMIERARW